MLCGISTYANKRQDVEAIYALLITQFQPLIKMNSPLVVLRLMRTISCYSIALYFDYIQESMKRGRVFVLEGIRCFERIIMTNQFKELNKLLATLMIKVLQNVSVTDSIMNLIVVQNYEKMVSKFPELYKAVREKIKH